MTNSLRVLVGACLSSALSVYARASAAHEAKDQSSRSADEYRIAAGPSVAREIVSIAGADYPVWVAGAGLSVYAGRRLAPGYDTGIELAASLLIPTERFALGGPDLEGAAFVCGTASWMNHINLGELTVRLGIGPAALHLTEGSGALDEETAWGLGELVGLAREFEPADALRLDLALVGIFTQTFSGSDARSSVDSVHSAGLMLSLGFVYGAPTTKTE